MDIRSVGRTTTDLVGTPFIGVFDLLSELQERNKVYKWREVKDGPKLTRGNRSSSTKNIKEVSNVYNSHLPNQTNEIVIIFT